MVDAIVQLRRVLGGRSRAELVADEVRYFAVLHVLQTIGEAASRTSAAFRAAHPEVPWTAIVAMRHRIVHGYDDVNDGLVWNAACEAVEQLHPSLERIVANGPEAPSAR